MDFSISPSASRREQIFFHASRLFIAKGFSATSMSDIAKAVGINKASLYHFIDSKEELLYTLMEWGMDILEVDVIEPSKCVSDPLERIRMIITNHLRNIAKVSTVHGNPLTIILDDPSGPDPEKYKLIRARKRAYFDYVRTCMKELEGRGQLAPLDPTVATFGVLGAILWFGRWIRPDGPIESDIVIAQLTDMCLRAALDHEAYQTLISDPSDSGSH